MIDLTEMGEKNNTLITINYGFGEEPREIKAGAQISGGTHDGQTPQGLTGIWEQAEGGKGGVTATGMAADSGT